jgi:hypothetical protein
VFGAELEEDVVEFGRGGFGEGGEGCWEVLLEMVVVRIGSKCAYQCFFGQRMRQ